MSGQNKYIVGIFDDEDVLVHSVEHIRHEGVKIHEVFSPFPIHGLDRALGYERSRIDIVAFLFGTLGFCLGITMIYSMMAVDWPMNIGGKPNAAPPIFIPVTFECTVLLTAYGMTLTFFVIAKLIPGFTPKMFDIRSTDDKFVVAIDLGKNHHTQEKIIKILKDNQASEVFEKEL
ncbi:MAG TPA: DUF3341 domain-containing protein [Cytophagales bacterium]|jgi:hypothetical protein|nr:DUF3341 domain-containing protein [Cytophagales bacterium]